MKNASVKEASFEMNSPTRGVCQLEEGERMALLNKGGVYTLGVKIPPAGGGAMRGGRDL